MLPHRKGRSKGSHLRPLVPSERRRGSSRLSSSSSEHSSQRHDARRSSYVRRFGKSFVGFAEVGGGVEGEEDEGRSEDEGIDPLDAKESEFVPATARIVSTGRLRSLKGRTLPSWCCSGNLLVPRRS